MPNRPTAAALPPGAVLLLHLALWQLHGPLLSVLDAASIAAALDHLTTAR